MTYLNVAIARGDFHKVRELIEIQHYSPNYTGFTGFNDTPLTVAAQCGQRKIMEYLIQKGADINLNGYYFGMGLTPIEAALQAQHTQVIATLLANDVLLPRGLYKTDIANNYLLKAASTNDTWSIDQLLAYTEANINVHDNNMRHTPLHHAVITDSFDAGYKLLEKGAQVNTLDIHSWTPLHYAASNSDTQFAKLLLEKGAKVNALDCHDHTPLFFAAQSGEEQLVNLLVTHGAKINHLDKSGVSVLDLAIINDDAEMVKCLVSHGAKISVGINNSTPLEKAAESGKLQALEALIELGSDLHHKNATGKTALELAFKSGEIGAVNILIMHGADVPASIQSQLDKMNTIAIHQVLPEHSLLIEDNSEQVKTDYQVSPIYAQPIGPLLGTLDYNDPIAFGG